MYELFFCGLDGLERIRDVIRIVVVRDSVANPQVPVVGVF
jgi:hypothetical protein